MVEYLRLIKQDWLPRPDQWQRQDMLLLVAALAVVLLIGYLVVRK